MIYKYPKSFARFYDTIYHQLRDSVDSEYFINEITSSGGRVLEIGAGTGRLFLNALKRGADVYALDISEPMIEILLGKLPSDQHYRISLQDIVSFSYNFKFDLIVAPFRVLMHLTDKDQQIRALNNVYDHLNNNGRFIFDTFVPDLNQIIKGLENRMDFEGTDPTGIKVRRYVSTTPDLINQTITVDFHLEWEENGKINHDHWIVPLRFFFRYELEHLIERSKFENYTIQGDYSGSELDSKSREFVVTCHKAGIS